MWPSFWFERARADRACGKARPRFLEKGVSLQECQIDFAFQADLDLHLVPAKEGHCGFSFFHEAKDGMQCTPNCLGDGHHRLLTFYYTGSAFIENVYGNHKPMEKTVLAWENCQLRAHQATIARLLAERLMYSGGARHFSASEELWCIAILTRLSIGSVRSFHSVPAWMEYQNTEGVDESDININGLDSILSDIKDDNQEEESSAGARIRPESTVLGPREDVVDFTMQWKNRKLTPVLKSGPSSFRTLQKDSRSAGHKNTYMEQVQSMRTPGGLKTRASGVRYRAKAATRYLLPTNKIIQESSQVRLAPA